MLLLRHRIERGIAQLQSEHAVVGPSVGVVLESGGNAWQVALAHLLLDLLEQGRLLAREIEERIGLLDRLAQQLGEYLLGVGGIPQLLLDGRLGSGAYAVGFRAGL